MNILAEERAKRKMKNADFKGNSGNLDFEAIAEIIKEADVAIDESEFYPRIFSGVSKRLKKYYAEQQNQAERAVAEEYDKLSHHLDKSAVQESCSVRNVLRTRRLANLLINTDGELQMNMLGKLIDQLEQHLYSFGPERQYDARRQEHILKVLKLLRDDENLRAKLLSINKPISHKHAERLIRATLQISPKVTLTDTHAKRAALSAWLCYLRQSVGSCFGTAPAILVQQEQPGFFLKDINELLTTGRLTRVFGGVEFVVPLSHSWGSGDLKKPIPLSKDMFEEEADPKERLWWSPGLLTALKKSGAIDAKQGLVQRRRCLKKLILKVLDNIPNRGGLYFATCEDLLRYILIDYHGLTKSAIKEFENRPRNMTGSPLMTQTEDEGTKKKGTPSAFIQDYEEAMHEFVSLADNALLKAWEFSLASFAETKSSFTKWNLYSSLGMGPQDAQGIGERLYQITKDQLDIANKKVADHQSEYEQVYLQVQMLENRLRRASSEQNARWIKSEYQTKLNEFRMLEEIRNKAHNRAKRMSTMYQMMIDRYYELFPQYFQEVYDADMHLAVGQYDDSPAGFHLLYKHGRANTSQWSSIRNPNDYVESLAAFFVATEYELVNDPQFEGLNKDISSAVTAIVSHIRSDEFIETAFHRMAIAHNMPPIKNPLDNLDKIEKKPWAYTSGGNVETLMSGYFSREHKPTVIERWVENEMELLVYIVDSLKQIPYPEVEDFKKIPDKSILMHSPTHVFLVKPFREPFMQAWQNEAYTYIWLRDHFKQPMTQFILDNKLDERKMQFIIDGLAKNVHPDLQPRIKQIFRRFPRHMRPPEFRDYILSNTSSDAGLPKYKKTISANDIDTFLFQNLPLFSNLELKDRIEKILTEIPGFSESQIEQSLKILDDLCRKSPGSYDLGAKQLIDACKALLCLLFGVTSTPNDYHLIVQKIAQKLGFAFPEPIIFADSNWVKGMFGFLVNPGTGDFELWYLDDIGSDGFPMNSWKHWLDGSRKDIPWGLYTKVYEYTAPEIRNQK